MPSKVSNNQKEHEQTSYFWTRDAHRDLHCPGLRLIPSDDKFPDISSQRAILPFTTWNLLCNSPRKSISFLTSSGFHLFRFMDLEDFDWEPCNFKDSSLLLSVPSFSTCETCSESETKPLLAFATSSTGDDDVTNAFQKSSESSEFEKCSSAKMELEVVVSSSGSSLLSSVTSPTWIIYDGRKNEHSKNQCQRPQYNENKNLLGRVMVIMTKYLHIPTITAQS